MKSVVAESVSVPNEEFITITDAAERLRASERTIRRMIKDGRLTAYRPTGAQMVRLLSVDVTNVMKPIRRDGN